MLCVKGKGKGLTLSELQVSLLLFKLYCLNDATIGRCILYLFLCLYEISLNLHLSESLGHMQSFMIV